jgi:hypothetical protein
MCGRTQRTLAMWEAQEQPKKSRFDQSEADFSVAWNLEQQLHLDEHKVIKT